MVLDRMNAEQKEKDWYHISKRSGSWAVRKQGAKSSISAFDSQKKAISEVKKLIEKDSSIIIHREDGTIRQWQVKR